ncbi:hypothetical protein R9C00_18975 [Flammeovirgaceae bacterium SG7u.111]|nr:hypothetical protein [Flammeovirgaceae bacterium SG7u.132]WPO33784.1 hypothetical protein R9C00_18975 [Flammeovirgaceae bacterium SG7u.111]
MNRVAPTKATKTSFLLVMLIFMFTLTGFAQKRKFKISQSYVGIELMGGYRATGTNTSQEVSGGTIGLVTGKDFIMVSIRGIGIYQSALNPQTNMSIFESQAAVNMHVLKMLGAGKSFIDFYPLAGISVSKYKFGSPDAANTTQPQKTTDFNGLSYNLGGGVVFKLKNRFKFVHLFAEVSNQHLLSASGNTDGFGLDKSFSGNIGLRIGRIFTK